MDAFELDHVAEERKTLGKRYLEFLRKPSISTGLYVLVSSATRSRVRPVPNSIQMTSCPPTLPPGIRRAAPEARAVR